MFALAHCYNVHSAAICEVCVCVCVWVFMCVYVCLLSPQQKCYSVEDSVSAQGCSCIHKFSSCFWILHSKSGRELLLLCFPITLQCSLPLLPFCPPLLCHLSDRRVLLYWNTTWSKNNNCSLHFPYMVAKCSKSAFGVSFGWAWPKIPHLVLAFTYLSSLMCGTGSNLYTTGNSMF